MHQQLADTFPHVSQQLVQAGSKLEREHRRCFLLACAVIDGLVKRVPDCLELLEDTVIDVRTPTQEPFAVIAAKESVCYGFLVRSRDQIWAAEGFKPADFEGPEGEDRAHCVNAFLNEGMTVLRTRRAAAAPAA
jgi:hypothetical protein